MQDFLTIQYLTIHFLNILLFMNNKLMGTGIALVTPFDKNGFIDFPALTALIEHCINGGVDFLVTLGTTGENVVLSETEQNEIIAHTLLVNKGRLPIVLGAGSNNTAALVQKLKTLNTNGLAAILSVTPYYNRPTQEGLFQHYTALAAVSPLPIILYNVPTRTGVNLTAATTLRLAHSNPIFIAVKEASGNISQAMEIIKNRPTHFAVLSGDDNMTLPILACGGDGVISVMGQLYPAQFSKMVSQARFGSIHTAQKLHYLLMHCTDLLFKEGNPAGIKAALAQLGICQEWVRLPLVAATEELKKLLADEISKIDKLS
jgi:4-hydroxy-tetrahydrodipicolinate synthase